MGFIKDWLGIILQVISLWAIIFSAIKIISKNEREWISRESAEARREDRLQIVEKQLVEMHSETKQIVGIEAILVQVKDEIARLRNRLDNYLDRSKE